MKLELKTDNGSLNSFSRFFKAISILALIIIFCDVAIKLGIISRHYQILYNCRVLSVTKSKSNQKKLSKIINIKSKQRISEFCRVVVK
ncbi:hypothetical protein [Prochlorococcus marinus]|uniref:hypothetical protein n=1 Tax=Prochlorococcus TaxID=1218 RepID=UPI0005178643|nr:hypothetical protein [Prochlorococcus marinus]